MKFFTDGRVRCFAIAMAVLFVGLAFTDTAHARRRRRVRNYRTYSYSNYETPAVRWNSPQEAAEAKAAMLARAQSGWHPYPGNYGGGYREGWGQGPTAEAAKWSTCFGGECQSARGSAQVQDARGWWWAINIW